MKLKVQPRPITLAEDNLFARVCNTINSNGSITHTQSRELRECISVADRVISLLKLRLDSLELNIKSFRKQLRDMGQTLVNNGENPNANDTILGLRFILGTYKVNKKQVEIDLKDYKLKRTLLQKKFSMFNSKTTKLKELVKESLENLTEEKFVEYFGDCFEDVENTIPKKPVTRKVKSRTEEILNDLTENSYWRNPVFLMLSKLNFYMQDNELTTQDLADKLGISIDELNKAMHSENLGNLSVKMVADLSRITGLNLFDTLAHSFNKQN